MDLVKPKTEEESDECDENELLGGDDENDHNGHDADGDYGLTDIDDIDETAEDLMTDMKLEDELDEVRAVEPDFKWSYHIEIYPWTIEDMTENFIKLIKVAQFAQIYMRKKGLSKGEKDTEKMDDKLQDRQRKGCVHFYTDNWNNAKNIIRSSTWKTMASKQLTYEITRRGPDVGQIESAYLEVDTYTACKCRFRGKAKGEFKDRTAKISNLPGTISREFLDVVFSRALAATGGGTSAQEYYKEKDGKLQQKLADIPGFDGSLNFDCISRGSCRSFVMAHKNVYIEGQGINIVANEKETMIAPPPQAENPAKPPKLPVVTTVSPGTSSATIPPSVDMKPQAQIQPNMSSFGINVPPPTQTPQGRGFWTSRARDLMQMPSRGMLGAAAANTARVSGKEPGQIVSRARGMGRVMVLPQRPVSAPAARGGMPTPMTGRQKMNEKMRRGNFGGTANTSGGTLAGITSVPGASMTGTRSPMMASIGDSFKKEIASLQSQLERNTKELEAKIAMLQQTSESAAAAFYETDMNVYQESGWDEGDFDYATDFCDETYEVEDLDDSYYMSQGVMPGAGMSGAAMPVAGIASAAMPSAGMHGFPYQAMSLQRPRMTTKGTPTMVGPPGNGLGVGFPGMGLTPNVMGGNTHMGTMNQAIGRSQGFPIPGQGMEGLVPRGGRGLRRGGNAGRGNRGAYYW